MEITTDKTGRATLTVHGTRCGVFVMKGPWVPGVDPRTIKVTPRRTSRFPAIIRAALSATIQNDTDDYDADDWLVLLPGHPLYDQAAAA